MLRCQAVFRQAAMAATIALLCASSAAAQNSELSRASALNHEAVQLYLQARYAEAEPLYKRSLAIREKALGPDGQNVAISIDNLAKLYRDQGRHADAEPLYKRSLALREKALGKDHPDVAQSLYNLAGLYEAQAQYGE